MKRDNTFEVIGMLQMAIRAFDSNPKAASKTELEKNGVEMIKESVRILTEDVLDMLSIPTKSSISARDM